MNDTLSIDDLKVRLQMALAEAGYPTAELVVRPTIWKKKPGIWCRGFVPIRVWWQAMAICDDTTQCWACYEEHVRRWRNGGGEPPLCLAVGQRIEDCGVDRSGTVFIEPGADV